METNQNLVISPVNLAEGATLLSSGECLAGFGLNKLLTPSTSESSRPLYSSEGALSIQVFFKSRANLKVVALIKHNLSQFDTYRVRLYTQSGGTLLYDSDVLPVFRGEDDFGTSAWGSFQWGSVVQKDNFKDFSKNILHLLDQEYQAGYMLLDFKTYELSPTYLESFMLWAGDGYQPELNADYGAEVVMIDETETKGSRSGARTYGSPIRRRGVKLDLSEVERTEAFSRLLGPVIQASGKKTLVLVSLTPLDNASRMFSSFVGNLTNTQSASFAFWNRMSVPIEIEESP